MEKKELIYTPTGGVCSKKMTIQTENDVITSVDIEGGCHGNAQGITALLKGMRVDDAINRMSGISCKGKGTSCPDQLAQALSLMIINQ